MIRKHFKKVTIIFRTDSFRTDNMAYTMPKYAWPAISDSDDCRSCDSMQENVSTAAVYDDN